MTYYQKIKNKIFSGTETLEPALRKWKEQKKKIVFTNGCFDLMHRGHAEYLARSADKGEILIVGLNSDLSVTKLKGHGRPLVDQFSRAFLLASMECVSAVVFFDDETPLKMIREISPDILVKGDDYIAEEIVGNEWVTTHGGRVETVELVPGWSTSLLLHKIKNNPE